MVKIVIKGTRVSLKTEATEVDQIYDEIYLKTVSQDFGSEKYFILS